LSIDATHYESPATLVAIIVAARRAGERELERSMRRELEERHRVKLNFAKDPQPGKESNSEG